MIKGFEGGGYICGCGDILPKGVYCCSRKKEKIQKICQWCGNNIKDHGNVNFCNMKCKTKFFKNNLKQICTGCGKNFLRYRSYNHSVNTYCTKECYFKHHIR